MDRGREWRHARKRWGFYVLEKKQLVVIQTWARPDDFVCYGRRPFVETENWVSDLDGASWFLDLAEARPVGVYEMCRTWWGQTEKPV